MIHVLRHPAEEVSVETIELAIRGALFVEAGATEHFVVTYLALLGERGEQLARGVLICARATSSSFERGSEDCYRMACRFIA